MGEHNYVYGPNECYFRASYKFRKRKKLKLVAILKQRIVSRIRSEKVLQAMRICSNEIIYIPFLDNFLALFSSERRVLHGEARILFPNCDVILFRTLIQWWPNFYCFRCAVFENRLFINVSFQIYGMMIVCVKFYFLNESFFIVRCIFTCITVYLWIF